MEYVLIARVSFRQHGDYTDTVRHIELGDFQIKSKEAIEKVAHKISSELNLTKEIYYNSVGHDDYPRSSEFYLETKEDEEGYGSSDMYKIQLIDSLRINGRLFELHPLDI